MNGHVTVSIVTPCYNGEPFLAETLQSALGQSRPPLEILVVDDGSTDGSADIAAGFGPPVRVIRQANQGESAARNRAIGEAVGTHLLFLDADDLLEPTAIERLAGAITLRDAAVALMGCAWFEDDPAAPYATRLPSAGGFFPSIIESNLAPPHCWLVPTDVVKRAGGFFEPLRWFEDWDLWWRVGLTGVELVTIQHVGALYRRHPRSQLATTKLADRARGHAILMTRMAEAFLRDPVMLARHGEQLFWSCLTALMRGREQSVPWDELSPLASSVRRLAREGPPGLTSSRMALAIRLIGVRTVTTLNRLVG